MTRAELKTFIVNIVLAHPMLAESHLRALICSKTGNCEIAIEVMDQMIYNKEIFRYNVRNLQWRDYYISLVDPSIELEIFILKLIEDEDRLCDRTLFRKCIREFPSLDVYITALNRLLKDGRISCERRRVPTYGYLKIYRIRKI